MDKTRHREYMDAILYTKKDFDQILSNQKVWKFSAISSLNSIFLR